MNSNNNNFSARVSIDASIKDAQHTITAIQNVAIASEKLINQLSDALNNVMTNLDQPQKENTRKRKRTA